MTTTSIIILNAALAAVVVVGILRLLVHGIRTDRLTAAGAAEARPAEAERRERLAA